MSNRTDFILASSSLLAGAPARCVAGILRYPAGMFYFRLHGELSKAGFFRFGSATCFGFCDLPDMPGTISYPGAVLPNAVAMVNLRSKSVTLPFDPRETATNLRLERYVQANTREQRKLLNTPLVRSAYYTVRKFMPVQFRKYLQRMHLADWRRICFPDWPVDCSVDSLFEQLLRLAIEVRGGAQMPFIWFWPNDHSGCLIMTHDVEQRAGRDFCSTLMKLEEDAGFRSSFQIIPEERYDVPSCFLEEIRRRGHEINVHDLNHDGNLFRERAEFLRRAAKIRTYARQFSAEGFRSGNPDIAI